jgi:hypothetical protein
VVQTIRRTAGWAMRLMLGRIERLSGPPQSVIPMRDASGAAACHATFDAPPARASRAVALTVAR